MEDNGAESARVVLLPEGDVQLHVFVDVSQRAYEKLARVMGFKGNKVYLCKI